MNSAKQRAQKNASNKVASVPNVATSFSKTKKLPEPNEGIREGQAWVDWGTDNLYPDWLNSLFYDSPYQSGIIRQKVFFVAGGGYNMEFGTPEAEQQFNAFVKGQPSDHGLSELIDLNTTDGEIYNGIAIRGVYNRKGTVSFLEAWDFDKVRTNANETMYYYSDNWGTKKQDPDVTGFKEIKPYNPLSKDGDFLIYYKYPSKEYRKGPRKTDMGLYPKPSYSGGLKDISTDIEMSSYHFHEILNSFKMGTLIYLGAGVPNPKDREKLEDEIKEGATGVDGAGGITVMYGKGDDQKPIIEHLNGNDLDKRYLMTEEAVQKKILIAHSVVTPTLFGIQTAGGLGNSTELENGYNIFVKTYVRARQKALEGVYNWIFKNVLKIDAKIELIEGELLETEVEDGATPEEMEANKVINAINGMSPLVANKVLESMTPNEIRRLAQLGADDSIIKDEAKLDKHGKKVDPILAALTSAGSSRKSFVVVSSQELPNEFTSVDASEVEVKHMKETLKTSYNFAELLTDFELNTLKLLSDGHDETTISEVLKVKSTKVAEVVEVLKEKKLLTKKNDLTNRGSKALSSQPANIDKFEVRYSYEKRSDATGPDVLPNNRTRKFCETLVTNNKLYTRKEIEIISSAVGRDVWAYRGGWWNRNGVNTPWCRHVWNQNIVYKP